MPPAPYPTLTSPLANDRGRAVHLTDKIAAAIAAPRGLVAAPVSRTTQMLGCSEANLTPLNFTFTIPTQYGTRNILCTWKGSGIMAAGDYVQIWINGVTGSSLPTLGGTARQKALIMLAQSAGGQSSYYGVLRAWALLSPGTYTFSCSGLAVGANCATGGPYASATDKMWFAIEDKGAG